MKQLIIVIMLILLSACGELSNEPQEINVLHEMKIVEHKKSYYLSAGKHTLCMDDKCFNAIIPKTREGDFMFVAHMDNRFYLDSTEGDIIVPLIEN